MRPPRRRPEERLPMRNILAIAHKELRAYFASPIAYIVIGFFALLYGFFFVAIMRYFVGQSMQAGVIGGAQALDGQPQPSRSPPQNGTVVLPVLLAIVTI